MCLKYIHLCCLVFIFCIFSLPAAAQQTQPAPQNERPCASNPRARQFDFWIGEWEVTEHGKYAGTNSVRIILGECVIFENWTGASGGQGKSFNFYNAGIGKWQQIWVDDKGYVLQLTGEFTDGAMRFTGETPGRNGGRVLHKLNFFPLDKDRVRQLWEQSEDNGTTWKTAFDGLYVRKKE